jgi:transposase
MRRPIVDTAACGGYLSVSQDTWRQQMGQRSRDLTRIFGFSGWVVDELLFEMHDGTRVQPVAGYDVPQDVLMVLRVRRRWAPRCECGAICSATAKHEQLKTRRWKDLPWAGRPVVIEYAPIRVKCRRCHCHAGEMVAWADRYQRQSKRMQQHMALDASSMPVLHVAAKYGLGWRTVRRAEVSAIHRWDATRAPVSLALVGVDEKYLGRRNKLTDKFVTIVSNLETGEPIWIGPGRSEATLSLWLASLTPEQKANIKLFAMDMHRAFFNAVRADPALAHAAIVHDPFHVLKRAGEAITDLRRDVFFRASPEMRRIGRGTRWLVLRAWENCTPAQQVDLKRILAFNGKLGRAYQIVEELRAVLKAPDAPAITTGLYRILRRTERRDNIPMRKLHDSLATHWTEIVALGEHHPPTGRIEALNNNWETLVRRGRGYRNHPYLLLKLRFMVANPIRSNNGVRRFIALGLPAPLQRAA